MEPSQQQAVSAGPEGKHAAAQALSQLLQREDMGARRSHLPGLRMRTCELQPFMCLLFVAHGDSPRAPRCSEQDMQGGPLVAAAHHKHCRLGFHRCIVIGAGCMLAVVNKVNVRSSSRQILTLASAR